jgi:hypothetical protein
MLRLDVFNMHMKDRSSLAYARKGGMTVSETWMRVRNAHYVVRIHLKLILVQATAAAAWDRVPLRRTKAQDKPNSSLMRPCVNLLDLRRCCFASTALVPSLQSQ